MTLHPGDIVLVPKQMYGVWGGPCIRCGGTEFCETWNATEGRRIRFCRTCAKARRQKNKDAARASRDEWNKANPDRVRQHKRDWRAKNKERVLEWSRNWRHANPEKVKKIDRIKRMQRHAAKLGVPSDKIDPESVFVRDGGRCHLCSKKIHGNYQIDHVIPLARGGPHVLTNVAVAHPYCNNRKGARLVTLF